MIRGLNVLGMPEFRRFLLQFPVDFTIFRLRQETLVFSNSIFNHLLRTTYVLLPGIETLWHDYCFYTHRILTLHTMKKLLLIPFTIIASVALFGPMASADTMQVTLDYGSRHSGIGGEFNAASVDFGPAAMTGLRPDENNLQRRPHPRLRNLLHGNE